jgi:hypothetical protein
MDLLPVRIGSQPEALQHVAPSTETEPHRIWEFFGGFNPESNLIVQAENTLDVKIVIIIDAIDIRTMMINMANEFRYNDYQTERAYNLKNDKSSLFTLRVSNY